jgi:outer membrane receptor protein involved in Fe transport
VVKCLSVIFLLFFFQLTHQILAQDVTGTVMGVVKSAGGETLPFATISIKGIERLADTDIDGNFSLTNVPAGTHIVSVWFFGFEPQSKTVQVLAGKTIRVNFDLMQDLMQMDEIIIVGKTDLLRDESAGYNVTAIDAEPYHNASVGLTQVIETAPGVKIQQEGGLGSHTNVTINGLSGRHVRFFIDGMPMDAMSSAFQINNLPVNLVDRIEVYKGVVPVNFGSDALGGAVNLVTKKTPGQYIDLSYSFGSFNTHMTFLNIGVTTKKGFTAQISAFQNYSDNNYYVDAKIKDFQTRIFLKEPERVRRFHDVYHNETVIAKIGFVNKPFADQLLFGITLGQEYDEIQHPAYLNLAFGEKYQTSNIIMPSFLYTKKNFLIRKLEASLAANYNFGSGHNKDVSDKEYNWRGEWRYSNSIGEIQHSDYVYKNNNGTINASANYAINENNRITANNVTSFYARQGNERAVVDDYINQRPRINNRNILGISYQKDWTDNFSTSLFGKRYSYYSSAYLNLSNTHTEDFQTISKGDANYGYGLASSYFLHKNLQIKANYEQACRMPESVELFGEVFGFYIANFDLKPEVSNNINFGFNYNKRISKNNALSADVNFVYRHTTDFIRLNVNYSQGEGSYENTELVTTPGVDAELRYSHKDRFNTGLSISYLKPRNFTKGTTYYKAILPNQPTFFGHYDVRYFLNDVWKKESRLSFNYSLQFINEFLYDYDTYKSSNRAAIPVQFNHSFFITYSLKKGKYNLSVDCKNILDARLYDNFSLQKPGRSFSVKFRYFFNKV